MIHNSNTLHNRTYEGFLYKYVFIKWKDVKHTYIFVYTYM